MSLNQDLLDKLVLSYFGQNKEIVKLFNDITKKYSCLFIHYILTIYIDNYKLKTEHLEVESMNDLKDESKFKYKEIEKDDKIQPNDIASIEFKEDGKTYILRETKGIKNEKITKELVRYGSNKKTEHIDTIIGKGTYDDSEHRINSIYDVNYINLCIENGVWKASERDACLNKGFNPIKHTKDICLNNNLCVFGYIGRKNLILLGIYKEDITLYPIRIGVCNEVKEINDQLFEGLRFLTNNDSLKGNKIDSKDSLNKLINRYEPIIQKKIQFQL